MISPLSGGEGRRPCRAWNDIRGRSGAGDERAGSHAAGDGAEDYLVLGGGDPGEQYERVGVDGVLDRRRCRPSEKRIERQGFFCALYSDRGSRRA